MAEYKQLPYLYPSMMEIGETYEVTMLRRSIINKPGKEGDVLIEAQISPAVVNNNGVSIDEGKMWFNATGDKHDPKEWQFVELTSGMMDGDVATVQRVGKPWRWRVTIAGELQEATSEPAPTPSPARTTPMAQTPSKGYSGPLLKDTKQLMEDCVLAVQAIEGEFPDESRAGWASTLFIQMCREGAALDYIQRKGLHLAGSKPAEDDDMPF